ncbi:MAG: hypothetical protein HW400_523 [Candidatus Levybacteria bacterium]|nr:hypothetical protein [Candidatus Levybacteria bacterium]
MKICWLIQVSELISTKKTLIEKLNNFFIIDAKHKMYQTVPADQILKSLKKSGVEGLELIFPLNSSEENIQKVKEIVKKHKMLVFSIHQSNESFYKIELSEIEKLCLIANKFSADKITLHVDALQKNIFNSIFVKELKKIQEKYKITFGIENMPKSFITFNRAHTYLGQEFLSAIGKNGLHINLDTTHLAQVNEDICDFYLKNKERIINIHLSDYKKHWLNRKLLLSNDTHLALGKGELPIVKFLKLLKKENYQGLITMEVNSDLQGLCRSAEMIKKITED